jgi:hypothetical protein
MGIQTKRSMKYSLTIIILLGFFSIRGQGGPGHNGNRTHLIKVNNAIKKTTHSAGEYHIIVSQAMRHDSLMVAKYNYKLDSLQKWEGRYYAHDSLRMIPWTDSLNKYRAKYSYDLQVADQAARRAIKK